MIPYKLNFLIPDTIWDSLDNFDIHTKLVLIILSGNLVLLLILSIFNGQKSWRFETDDCMCQSARHGCAFNCSQKQGNVAKMKNKEDIHPKMQ